MSNSLTTLCVYCGSSPGFSPVYQDATLQLADLLVAEGITLVFGGSSVGLMGILADRVLEQGGKVIGVIPQALVDKELAHQGLTELHVVASMHARKAKMAELADGFIALPGGMGTLEELFEMLTWAQLGFHQKSCAVLNVDGYYESLLSFLEGATSQGFIRDEHRHLLLSHDQPAQLLELMRAYQAPQQPKWITASET
ncbi:LOG family protein YvdD [Pseudidiomarina piscicola]|uniref:Cytokinin riboside 5'-monophosphate phosphoribohydrolase n=1 Tax=Pseudidiomarina piscicola TaxID=2614830 RepID=A0A6S6WKL6_9GAMM|nr:TIGR00730 family Rossman fold protein [Pseudidiomarina piscicola]CAB0151337.1 LOG family protein YvdD [Pseudidiomarina piscicola]VZT40818.1 LOG family protein YvdD [Pseudomonas aeruginosa]